MQGVYPLKGKVQHYSWGGARFIPELLQIANSELRPFAEYWLGAHPNFPSTIEVDGQVHTLDKLLQNGGAGALGREVQESFGGLPYLFKVLDVAQMLSIQVHPSKEEARKGYEAENRAGIPLTAPHRNYKDANHKPEQMVALGDFYLLHGFKPAGELAASLAAVPELAPFVPVLEGEGLRALYAHVMTMEQGEVNALWRKVAERILPLYKEGRLRKEDADFWAARAMATFCQGGDYDRGLFSVYFLNLVVLRKGESVFQPEGMPHAYLEGQNIEVMANSDNVLRGGLTEKHVDVGELMRHTVFEATHPRVLQPDERGTYPSGASEFILSRGDSTTNLDPYTTASPEIFLVLRGELTFAGASPCTVSAGGAAFATAGASIALATAGETEFYRVGVPRA